MPARVELRGDPEGCLIVILVIVVWCALSLAVIVELVRALT